MPNSLRGVVEYARDTPKRDGGTWAGWCASFVYRAGGFSRAFPTALAAGDAAGDLNPAWDEAPAGAIHYWAGVGGMGHVAFELGGGTLLMASASVSDSWGTAMGTVSFPTYARLRIPYRGWSTRWGNETLSGAGLAGELGPEIEEDDMYNDLDRVRDNLVHEAVGRIELNLYGLAGMVHRAVAASEVSKYVLVDGGLRDQVAKVLAVVSALDAGDLTEEELRKILGEASGAAAAEEIADAVAARTPQLSDIVQGVIAALPKGSEVTPAAVAEELAKRLAA